MTCSLKIRMVFARWLMESASLYRQQSTSTTGRLQLWRSLSPTLLITIRCGCTASSSLPQSLLTHFIPPSRTQTLPPSLPLQRPFSLFFFSLVWLHGRALSNLPSLCLGVSVCARARTVCILMSVWPVDRHRPHVRVWVCIVRFIRPVDCHPTRAGV